MLVTQFGQDAQHEGRQPSFSLAADNLTVTDLVTGLVWQAAPDTDLDGLSDGDEVHTHGTDPLDSDSDDGGIPDGKKFKAVQTGGPSGGCLPADKLDMPVDFDQLTKVGSMMGSGGMIVMDEDTCMVDVARYFVEFLADESCGKCLPCREGLRQMHRILTAITEGRGEPGDLDTLAELAEAAREASLCALGRTAPNPFLSTLRYFRDEYEAHIAEKRCPALSCKDLIAYHIDPEKCQACMICARRCPVEAIEGGKNRIHVIDQEKCIKCGTCLEACPPRFGAVQKIGARASTGTPTTRSAMRMTGCFPRVRW